MRNRAVPESGRCQILDNFSMNKMKNVGIFPNDFYINSKVFRDKNNAFEGVQLLYESPSGNLVGGLPRAVHLILCKSF